jgi:hypothetical protein
VCPPFHWDCICQNLPKRITPLFLFLHRESYDSIGNTTNNKYTETVSKIYKTKDIYYNLAGNILNGATQFNAAKIIDTCIKENDNLSVMMEQTSKALEKEIGKELAWIKSHDPNYYKEKTNGSSSFITAGIAAFEKGSPFLQLFSFDLTGDCLEVNKRQLHKSNIGENNKAHILGERDAIAHFPFPSGINCKNDVSAVEKMFELQIEKTPEKVGYPIDILILKAGGETWVKKQDITPSMFEK